MRFWFQILLFIVVLLVPLLVELGNSQQPQFLEKIVADTINSVFGNQILPMGDQNDDGYDDIFVYDDRHFFQLFLGGQSVSNVPQFQVDNQRRPQGFNYDANGDGYIDWAVHSLPGNDNRINVYFAGPLLDTLRDWWFGDDTATSYSLFTAKSCDINASGQEELVSDYQDLGNGRINFYELVVPWDSGVDFTLGLPTSMVDYLDFPGRFALGDLNGDGWQDIAVAARPRIDGVSGAVCLFFGGPTFDTLVDVIFYRPGGYVLGSGSFGRNVLLCPGDINSDGWDDLIIGSGNAGDDSLTSIYFGGPGLDTIPDLTITEYISNINCAGDINHDGALDLISSLPLSWIGGLHVQLYYGGADIDSIPDWQITGAELPGLNSQVGMEVIGIGDYNGDDVDDFAFSTIDNQTGTVWIYAGFRDPTDVPYVYNPTLPSGYGLSQNFPNPFNPTTRISFSLPVAGSTELVIYNLLGKQIRVLINGTRSAGQYSIEWNGLDSQGRQVASGVYFYQLTSGDYSDSRKMLKLK